MQSKNIIRLESKIRRKSRSYSKTDSDSIKIVTKTQHLVDSIISHEISTNLVKTNRKKEVGAFWPSSREPDLVRLFIESGNIKISLPKVLGEQMRFLRYDIGTKLVKNELLGIMEPKNTHVIIPEMMIIPGLAFGQNGYRIGFGTGHFDKYLNKNSDKSILKIGVCFDDDVYTSVPYENHDIKLDYLVTEQNIIKFS